MTTGAIVNAKQPAMTGLRPKHNLPSRDTPKPRISHLPRGARTQDSPTKSPAWQRSSPEERSPALREPNVTAQDLQKTVLFVLGLFASLAVLNLHAEMAHLIQHWHRFVEFLASSIF